MKAAYRFIMTFSAVAVSVMIILFFTFIGSRAQGPLQDVMTEFGALVREGENWVVTQFRGPGRASRLAWFKPYTTDPARLKNPGIVLLGTYDDKIPRTLEGVAELEKSIGTTLPLIHIYTAWGDKPEQQFPLKIVQAISDYGSLPVVTWEPWLTDFEAERHPHLSPREKRDKGGMAGIARGEYDFYVDTWASDAAAYGKPLFVRLGHEMNDPYRYPWGPQNNKPEDFIAAWRHVVKRFRVAGAKNVLWVWSPHPAYGYFQYFYPGDDVVDWVGAGALNYGTAAHWSQWWSFEDILGNKYPQFAAFGKPLMVTEFGTLAVGGSAKKWYTDALTDLPKKYPMMKSILFFHTSYDPTVTYKALDWSFSRDSVITAAISRAISPWLPEKTTYKQGRSR